jgi:hypothetical protein
MNLLKLLATCLLAASLSGCLLAAAGAGAAGGVYVDKNYDISVHKKHQAEKKDASAKTTKESSAK